MRQKLILRIDKIVNQWIDLYPVIMVNEIWFDLRTLGNYVQFSDDFLIDLWYELAIDVDRWKSYN